MYVEAPLYGLSKALQNFKLKSIYLSFNNNQTKKTTNYILKNYKNLLIQIHYDFIQVYKYHTVNYKLQNIFFKMNLPFCEYLYKVFLIYFNDENINEYTTTILCSGTPRFNECDDLQKVTNNK